MSIRWDSRNKAWRFEFDRVIQGKRHRTSKLLPKGWSQAAADKFDRDEGARLYAVATGVETPDALIETAVHLYLQDKTALKSHKSAVEHLAAIMWAYEGKTLTDLPAVAAAVAANREGSRTGKVLGDATVHQRLALLKAACRWAWKKHGLCDHDPTGRMQLPTVRNERHVYATRQQVGQLAWAADRRDARRLILVAFYTGMRLGEILRTQIDHGGLYLADTKNGSRRAIPVHPKLERLIKHLPFTAPKITLQRCWERARARVGLAHMHLHDLRHTTASEMINAGVDLYTVGAVLGHKDARSTQRYAHLRPATLAAAVGMIGQKTPHKASAPDKKKAA